METIGDTRLRHLTCLSDDAIDWLRRWTRRRNIDRNANKKNMNLPVADCCYCDRLRASGVSRSNVVAPIRTSNSEGERRLARGQLDPIPPTSGLIDA